MGDNVREYLQAAQSAEIRGDKPRAIELLNKAADLYERAGNQTRSEQMRRHAERLARRTAQIPASAPAQKFIDALSQAQHDAEEGEHEHNVTDNEDVVALPRARGVSRELAAPQVSTTSTTENRGKQLRVFDRGPSAADDDLDAWCSFCCRPKSEVGELAKGPAGALICASCLGESARILKTDVVKLTGQATRRPTIRGGQNHRSFTAPAGARVDDAIESGRRFILIVGPPGSGKSTYLRRVRDRGAGTYLAAPSELSEEFSSSLVLIDELHLGSTDDFLRLASWLEKDPSLRVVAACRGQLPDAMLEISHGTARARIVATADLAPSTVPSLPLELAERVDYAETFDAFTRDALVEIGEWIARELGRSPTAALLRELADLALRSGRGAHELRALISRLPAGEWDRAPRKQRELARAKGKRRRGRS